MLNDTKHNLELLILKKDTGTLVQESSNEANESRHRAFLRPRLWHEDLRKEIGIEQWEGSRVEFEQLRKDLEGIGNEL